MLLSSAAGAKPSDVPDYVAQTVSYAAGTSANSLGSNPAPYLAQMPADIPSDQTGYVINAPQGASQFCVIDGVSCTEAKFRTHADCDHILNDDPIRNFGQPGASHLHEFCGNRTTNAHSTYVTQRTRPGSDAAGGILNATGYWFPCPVKTNPFGDGKNYCVRADYMVIYYTQNPTRSPFLTRLPRGLRYVFGTNMDDPDDLSRKAEVTAANAQAGTSGRYSYRTNGFVGWHCLNGSSVVGTAHAYLKESDGSDPWGGACTAGMQMYAQIDAPNCWDGHNPWSPGGYNHMRYKIQDNTTGQTTCPQGWYEVPTLEIKVIFTHSGFSDYGNWRLSSDDMAATAAGHTMRNGESFHTDWLGSWDDTIFTAWQKNCVGVGGLNGTPHQCNDSVISDSQKLITSQTAPDGRSPQLDLSQHYGTASAGSMFLIPATPNGPKTIHIHG
jgi:hypothetical protein